MVVQEVQLCASVSEATEVQRSPNMAVIPLEKGRAQVYSQGRCQKGWTTVKIGPLPLCTWHFPRPWPILGKVHAPAVSRSGSTKLQASGS